MDMGDRIKKLRLEKDLTQEELGKLIGVKKAAVQKYESGLVQNIKRSKIQLLANALGVSPAYLMGWEPNLEIGNKTPYVEELYEKIESLNEQGCKMLSSYADGLLTNREYLTELSGEATNRA